MVDPAPGARRAFHELLVRAEVIRFGDFRLKSGRRSPYFIDAGRLHRGATIAGAGRAYFEAIRRAGLAPDFVFGPAYKGVPLAVATSIAAADAGADLGFCFDRKHEKDHGERGWFVGVQPAPGLRAVIVDDVITSGGSIRDAVWLLTTQAQVEVCAVVIAVDRKERGSGGESALTELSGALELPIHAVTDIEALVDDLHGRAIDGVVHVDDRRREQVEAYLREHGAS